jgi:hypothetical protein
LRDPAGLDLLLADMDEAGIDLVVAPGRKMSVKIKALGEGTLKSMSQTKLWRAFAGDSTIGCWA